MESAGDGTRWVPDVCGMVGFLGVGLAAAAGTGTCPGWQISTCRVHSTCLLTACVVVGFNQLCMAAPAPSPSRCRARNGTLLLNMCHCTRPAAVR